MLLKFSVKGTRNGKGIGIVGRISFYFGCLLETSSIFSYIIRYSIGFTIYTFKWTHIYLSEIESYTSFAWVRYAEECWRVTHYLWLCNTRIILIFCSRVFLSSGTWSFHLSFFGVSSWNVLILVNFVFWKYHRFCFRNWKGIVSIGDVNPQVITVCTFFLLDLCFYNNNVFY